MCPAERRGCVFALAGPVGELAFLIAAVLFIDYQFFDNTRFWGADFDPFWLPVLLLSVQYGAGFGAVVVIASSVALLTGPLPPQTLAHDPYSYSLLIAQRPALWMIGAVVLGSLSGQHLRLARRFAKKLAETDQQKRVIATAYGEAQRANDALVLRLNSERVTLSQVSSAIQRLLGRSSVDVIGEVDDLVGVTLGARKFSIFVARANCLEAVRWQGWKADGEFTRVYANHSPLFRAVAEQRRLLCIANPLDEVFLGRDGVLAGPICNPRTGQVLGMLKIEDLDFYRFGAETMDNFRIAAEWLGFALASAGASESRCLSSAPQVSSGDPVAVMAADRELSPCPTEFELIISVVSVRFQLGGSEMDLATVREAIRQAVCATLPTDQLIETGKIGAEFFIVLPGTSAEIARLYAKTLEPALRQRLPLALQNMAIDIREKVMCLARTHRLASLVDQQAA